MADIIKKFDYFNEGKKEFYSRFSHESVLCQGSHWEKNPFVTILIPTYKRPELLSQALESALNQTGFDDYQIIVVDNEGAPIEEETSTSKVIKNYHNERVIYYRHLNEVSFRADAAVKLARSPWIVFLHDDDLLSENHLKIMTDIVKKQKKIKYLGCPRKGVAINFVIEKETYSSSSYYLISKFVKDANCLGIWPGWLGAMINRECYIAIGGMPSVSPGCGDIIMAAKFLHYYEVYMCKSNKALYYYRIGEQQQSYILKKEWENAKINKYFFYKYVICRYHKWTHRIWERNIAYFILEECEKYNDGVYNAQININNVISECNMPKKITSKDCQYYITKCVFGIRKKVVNILGYINFYNMKKIKVFMCVMLHRQRT